MLGNLEFQPGWLVWKGGSHSWDTQLTVPKKGDSLNSSWKVSGYGGRRFGECRGTRWCTRNLGAIQAEKPMSVKKSLRLGREQSIPLQDRNRRAHPPSDQGCKGNSCPDVSFQVKCRGSPEYARRLDIPVQDLMFVNRL